MFETVSFVRAAAFAVLYAGIEYRYVNRKDAEWTKSFEGFFEKPVFWKVFPYHAYLLLPVFLIVAYTLPLTAWAGNTFLITVTEDIAYFVWRGRSAVQGEWTTTLFGSFTVGRYVIPTWWPLGCIIVATLYLVPM